MGVSPVVRRAVALNASDGWTFSMEFPLAAFFPFGSRDLCRGDAALPAGITGPGYSDVCSHCFDSNCHVNLACNRLLRFPADMDFFRARGDLVTLSAFVARFENSRMRTCSDYV